METQLISYPFIFQGLSAGNYDLTFTDLNGCTATITEMISEPGEFLVSLGPDREVQLGDSIQLNAQFSLPYQSIRWEPETYLSHPDTSTTITTPLATINYRIVLTDSAGCTGTDDILIQVTRNNEIFVPNIISSGDADDNAWFTLYSGGEVRQIRTMMIYDRWGDLVFSREKFQPNLPLLGWDGSFRGKVVPAVYAYIIEIERFDGTTEYLKGDLTVIR